MTTPINKATGNQAIDRFLAACHVRHFPAKSVVIHAGDKPDTLYFILDGSVAVIIEDEEGNEIVLSYLNRGEFFGEMGMFIKDSRRSAWVRTRTEAEIAEMHYGRFKQLADENPDLLFQLASQLAARLGRTTRKVGDLAFLDVTGRIARTLFDVDIPLGSERFRWVTTFEIYDVAGWNRKGDRRPHLKWLNRMFIFRSVYLTFGADDFASKNNANAFFGAGLRWGDDDIKFLMSSFSSGIGSIVGGNPTVVCE